MTPTDPLSDEALAELRQYVDAASDAPWSVVEDYGCDETVVTGGDTMTVGMFWQARDADLIAAARNGLPGLLSRLAAAETELERFGTNAELLSCSTMGEAFDRLEQLVAAEANYELTAGMLTSAERELEAARAHIARMRPVLEYVSRGRSFVGVGPYPDATARFALGALDEATAPDAPASGDDETARAHISPGVTHKMFDVQHPAHVGQTCEQYDNAVAGTGQQPAATDDRGLTCRECGHTADDHHPAEGSIRPIGCQRLDCDCSFTLLDIEVKP